MIFYLREAVHLYTFKIDPEIINALTNAGYKTFKCNIEKQKIFKPVDINERFFGMENSENEVTAIQINTLKELVSLTDIVGKCVIDNQSILIYNDYIE